MIIANSGATAISDCSDSLLTAMTLFGWFEGGTDSANSAGKTLLPLPKTVNHSGSSHMT